MNKKVRPEELGYLFVVGGPGSSGSSTISVMLANEFSLKRVYGGEILRDIMLDLGFPTLESAYNEGNMKKVMEIDKKIDEYLIKVSKTKTVLIESKVFAGIAKQQDIPVTVSIWLDASLHVRTMRSLEKLGFTKLIQRIKEYIRIRKNLAYREKFDRGRYMELYGVDSTKPKRYYDIVLNTSHMDEKKTFKLILKLIKDGGYIKE